MIIMEYIKGNVAKILNEYTVILNIGFKSKVEEGMKFIIYSEGEEIFDPISGASLGKFENVKAKVKVINVAENYSVARSDEYELTGGVTSAAAAALAAFSGFNQIQVNKKLSLDEETKRNIVEFEKDSVIREKDLVRQIVS
jgi:hypothetical protein